MSHRLKLNDAEGQPAVMLDKGKLWISLAKAVSILALVVGAVWFVKGSIDESNNKIDNNTAKIEQLQQDSVEKNAEIEGLKSAATTLTIAINRLSDKVDNLYPKPVDSSGIMQPKVMR